ncbi:tay bridge kinase isoform X2 [Leptinotarsa decemlineata]|uniref:tay bridge kinase isoform X2 n=1 Tax=Leptinotarsa decemlineata TaxID=7539 RepID=UPI003D3088DA
MDVEVKQRNRRRKRAQRMQAQREINKADHLDGDSGDEDVIPAKPPRPPNRRKKAKEPLCEEDIIDGFSVLQFRTYEDLELVLKISTKENIKRLTEIERPKIEPKAHITNHILVQHNHGLTLNHDPATSDDSGRASERLTGSSVAPRDADSSRDRLSDASSRCSSGKGYICDSEGEDDKGSDASSVIFPSTPASRKHEFPGALPPSLPSLNHGTSSSPVPAPTPPNIPVPSPAPAQQPPQHPPQAIPSAAVSTSASVVATPTAAAAVKPIQETFLPPPPSTIASVPQTPMVAMPSVPTAVAMPPQPAAAAPMAHHPPALDSTTLPGGHAMRTDSPAVATSANVAVAPSPSQYHHPSSYQPQPLYAPYAAASATVPQTHATTPYVSNVVAAAATIPAVVEATPPPPQPIAVVPPPVGIKAPHLEREKQMVAPSPRGPSPVRENRESYSCVSSLSRSSVTTTLSCPPPTTAVSSSLASSLSKPWSGSAQPAPPPTQVSPAPPRPTPPLHSTFPANPMFAAPLPPPVSRASPMTAPAAAPPQANPNPFSAESLFQPNKYPTNQADMLRRELDNRFLASQDRTMGVAPPPYLRTEMHQHQHHHTHVHQHTTSLLPPPAASSLYPSQLSMSPMERLARRSQSSFKDIPKLGSVESSFYRQNMGLPGAYPGYAPGLMHPGLTTGPTPFAPPNHLPTFQPKKSGKWNAMHVRVAWEIYHHQQKSGEAKGSITTAKPPGDLLRPPTHLFSPSVHSQRPPHDLSPFPLSLSGHRPPGYDQPHHPGSLFSAPPGHLGKSPFTANSAMSPFTRYGGSHLGASGTSPFSMSPFAAAAARESHLGLGPLHHDPWRSLQRTIPNFPPTVNPLPPTLPGLTQPGPAPWAIKPDPILEQREREAREREERERERLRREREERERREREEKQRRIEQQQQEQRERERKEREKREMERRELERQRERERERLLQEQRMAETAKLQPTIIRDRSPLRNGDLSEIRVKEEPRVKEEDIMSRSDARYHPYLRHPGTLPPPPTGHPSMLDRTRMLQHALPPHPYHHAPATHWGAPPQADPFYRYSYNPLVDAMRAQEERANFFNAYNAQHHQAQLRPKDPALMQFRTGPGPGPPPTHLKMSITPPTDLHKKEEPR